MLRAYISTLIAVAALTVGGAAFAQTPPPEPSAPIAEESDVATLPSMGPRWLVLTSQWGSPSTRIVDGDTGKQLATLHTASLSNVAVDPNGKFFYVAETIWTKGNRGDRQDMLTIYDAATLALVTEINLPGRLLVGLRRQNLDVSQDGRFAYVYDMSPASSVIVIDLVKRKVAQTVEVPGCGLVFAAPAGRVASLCGNGSLATISFDTKSKPTVDQTAPFFSADDDPIFDNSIVDRTTGKAIFLSYSGLIYETVVDGRKDAPKSWSLQEAAGLTKGSTAPLAVGWLPGGRQLMAYHPQSNRLYVLMHVGEFWTQKESGTELWVVDMASRKVLKRHHLAAEASYVEVSREASPVVFVGAQSAVSVLDGETLEQKRSISVRGQMIAVAGR